MNRTNNYELILIDADDTLFDFGACEDEALREAFEAASPFLDEAAAADYREINAECWLRVEKGLATQARIKYERFESLLLRIAARHPGAALPDPRTLAEAYIERLSGQRVLIAGAERLVAYLARSYTLVLVTNGIAQVQRGRFGPSVLSSHFRGLVISEEVGAAKPDPRIFAKALELGGSPEKSRVLMIGDSLSSDIAGAIAFGIDACWYNPGGKPRGETAPTYEVRRLEELELIL